MRWLDARVLVVEIVRLIASADGCCCQLHIQLISNRTGSISVKLMLLLALSIVCICRHSGARRRRQGRVCHAPHIRSTASLLRPELMIVALVIVVLVRVVVAVVMATNGGLVRVRAHLGAVLPTNVAQTEGTVHEIVMVLVITSGHYKLTLLLLVIGAFCPPGAIEFARLAITILTRVHDKLTPALIPLLGLLLLLLMVPLIN